MEFFNFFSPYSRCYIPNLVKIGPVALEKKMLTHDQRRTTDDARKRTPTHSCDNVAVSDFLNYDMVNIRMKKRKGYIIATSQPIAIGHLSDSGDLKTNCVRKQKLHI